MQVGETRLDLLGAQQAGERTFDVALAVQDDAHHPIAAGFGNLLAGFLGDLRSGFLARGFRRADLLSGRIDAGSAGRDRRGGRMVGQIDQDGLGFGKAAEVEVTAGEIFAEAGHVRPLRMPRADAEAEAHPGDGIAVRTTERGGQGLDRTQRQVRTAMDP